MRWAPGGPTCRGLGLTDFFIIHDLGVICSICDDVAVIHRGKLVEQGPVERIFERPESDHTRMVLAAMPDPDPDRAPFRQAGKDMP